MINIELDPRIIQVCPQVQIGAIRAHVVNHPTPDGLWALIEERAEYVRHTYELLQVNERPAIAATRRLYKSLGKDPGRYRVASEQLCRRIIKGLGLYRLTSLIDITNLVSFTTGYAISGLDADKRYTQEEIDELVARSPYYRATANDVDWLMKVRMQGAIQKWVDHSISVTVNLPNDVDEALVNRLYVEAWKSGCKGCTIYRDGSRAGVMISVSKKDKKKDNKEGNDMSTATDLAPCKHPEVTEVRPQVLECDVVCSTAIPTRYSPVCRTTRRASCCPSR